MGFSVKLRPTQDPFRSPYSELRNFVFGVTDIFVDGDINLSAVLQTNQRISCYHQGFYLDWLGHVYLIPVRSKVVSAALTQRSPELLIVEGRTSGLEISEELLKLTLRLPVRMVWFPVFLLSPGSVGWLSSPLSI